MSETYDEYESWEDEGQDSPLALVAILVMALTSAAIVANLLFMQPKSAEIAMISKVDKMSTTERSAADLARKPLANKVREKDSALHADKVAMTLAIQRQLTMAGYYVGPLDGQEGRQTQEAIAAYQDAVGLPVTGKLSNDLHDILTGRKAFTPINTSEVKTQAVSPQANEIALQNMGEKIAFASLPRDKPSQAAEPTKKSARLSVTPRPEPTAQAAAGPIPPAPIPSSSGDPTLAKVQSALKQYGYGDLTVDGVMGSRTQAAIADFQRSRGHPVTGIVNDRLLKEMLIMGYLDLG